MNIEPPAVSTFSEFIYWLDAIGHPRVVYVNGKDFMRLWEMAAPVNKVTTVADGPSINFMLTTIKYADWPENRLDSVDCGTASIFGAIHHPMK